MVCWLCTGQPCRCCAYLEARPQPFLPVPEFATTAYNSAVEIGETARLSRIFFLEASSFDLQKTAPKRKRADYYDEPDEASDDSDDSDDGLWKRAGRRVRMRQDETAEETMRRQITSTLDPAKEIPLCITRLLRFIRLLEIFNTKPNADMLFPENEYVMRMLVASYLKFIVGEKEWKENMTMLYPLIESVRDLSNVLNVVWTTNRQHGKTTVLSRIVAALSLLSPIGGELVYVYSTARDRAQGLVNEAKDYLLWINKRDNEATRKKLAQLGLPCLVRFRKDNTEMYIVESWAERDTYNTVKARPQKANSCRGDAFKVGVFDEIAFVEESFWNKFAMPLLAVAGRVFTMATTPPKLNSFFDVFVKTTEANNAKNDNLFMLVNHSIMCDACFKLNKDACHHKLYLVPPWKSTMRIKNMFGSVSEKGRRDFQAEVRNPPHYIRPSWNGFAGHVSLLQRECSRPDTHYARPAVLGLSGCDWLVLRRRPPPHHSCNRRPPTRSTVGCTRATSRTFHEQSQSTRYSTGRQYRTRHSGRTPPCIFRSTRRATCRRTWGYSPLLTP
jgi:hypothetical protein